MNLIIGNILVSVVLLLATESVPTSEYRQTRDTLVNNNTIDIGKPLILTPFIQNGQIKEARTQSRVPRVLGMDLESYSGYFTVRADGDANLFFWFFPALNDSANKPLVLWMEGGPGLTSMNGNFGSIGPYYITDDGKVKRRNVTWVSEFNIIFIDNPVGTGFSYAKSVDYYTNTSSLIARDTLEAIKQFLEVFIEYKKNDFYICGQSYAAKYAIVMADILTTNSTSGINFKGLILPSGLFDPANNLKSAEYLYQTSIIDKKTMNKLSDVQKEIVELVQSGQYIRASNIFFILLNGGIPSNDSISDTDPSIIDVGILAVDSGIESSENILYDNEKDDYTTYTSFLNFTTVRFALHVGWQEFNYAPLVILDGIAQSGDLATPFVTELQNVLNRGYKTLIISGNMDYSVPTPGVIDSIDSFVWTHAEQYAQTKRTLWVVNDDDANTAGYIKCASNLCFTIIRNAGHFLAGDEPLKTLTIVDRFVNNKA